MLEIKCILLLICAIALNVGSHARVGGSGSWQRDVGVKSSSSSISITINSPDWEATRATIPPNVVESPPSPSVLSGAYRDNGANTAARRLDVTAESSTTSLHPTTATVNHVFVYHFIMQKWGGDHDELGELGDCGTPNLVCNWANGDTLQGLKNKAQADYDNFHQTYISNLVEGSRRHSYSSATVYNYHSWWERTREHYPHVCNLRTNVTLVESEEARQRYGELFDASFKNFDGFSTTHPTSSVQRLYREAYLPQHDFVKDSFIHNFSSLIRGGIYVASDCHTRDKANAHRDDIVFKLRSNGLRIDGLGRCMYSNPDEITIPRTRNTDYNLLIKRQTVARYMFYMAFENSIEPGYVTEKAFDGLLAGTVPVYVGDDVHLKSLLPHPKSVIFVADYNGNYTKLVEYLSYLSTNETAYEEHRSWRTNYNATLHRQSSHRLLRKSWFCHVCDWVLKEAPIHHKRTRACNSSDSSGREMFDHNNVEGKAVQGDSRQVFIVEKHTLRAIPDVDTFYALKLDWKDVIHLTDADLKKIPIGAPIPKVDS